MFVYKFELLRSLSIHLRKKVYLKLPFFFKFILVYFVRRICGRYVRYHGHSVFPVRNNGGTFFQKVILGANQNEGYFCNYYREKNVSNLIVNNYDYQNYKAEIVYAKKNKGGCIQFLETKKACLIPLSIINSSYTNEQDDKFLFEFKVDEKTHVLRNISQNRFHYIPLHGGHRVEISSPFDFLVGNPIPTEADRRCKKKLVLNIFIDGLAAEIFRDHELQRLMPNCFKFFGKSFITTNCNTNSDWTDPSVPTIFSGLYSINHRVFDETSPAIGENYKIMSEYFQENGYTTFQVCSNYGKTPIGGYVKGFDRTIYKRSMGGRNSNRNFNRPFASL